MPQASLFQGFAQGLFGALLLALASGCSAQEDALRKDIQALREEVGRVRAQNQTLAARVETLEIAKTQAPPNATSATSATREDDRPSLDVVRLEPSQKAKTGDTAARAPEAEEPQNGQRPLLRSAQGGAVVAQHLPAEPAKPKAPPLAMPPAMPAAKGTPR